MTYYKLIKAVGDRKFSHYASHRLLIKEYFTDRFVEANPEFLAAGYGLYILTKLVTAIKYAKQSRDSDQEIWEVEVKDAFVPKVYPVWDVTCHDHYFADNIHTILAGDKQAFNYNDTMMAKSVRLVRKIEFK